MNIDFSKVKQAKWKDYRSLLARSGNETLPDNDRENLLSIMAVLNITEAELGSDLLAIGEHSRLETVVANAKQVEKTLDEVRQKITTFQAETVRINAQRHAVLMKLSVQETLAVQERSQLQDAWSQLPTLKRNHPRLFGDNPRPSQPMSEPFRDVKMVVPLKDIGISTATRDERFQLLKILEARQ